VPGEDTTGQERARLSLEAWIIIAGTKPKDTEKLEQIVEIAVGMSAMVIVNIATEADLTNGTRGEVVDIVLDPRETVSRSETNHNDTVQLTYPPAAIIFRPTKYNFPKFPGLQEGLIPIFPTERTFAVAGRGGRKIRVTRRQMAPTSGYAFTDYKAQGQTLEYVIVDLAKPPTGYRKHHTVWGLRGPVSKQRTGDNQTLERF
jgi:hypothetical protein